ncbi:MAG: DEAD/DEAH box helicase family protein [Methanoculleus sp.]|jgi:superfamily II DNA or RNA helicase|nr:DEAD/DEAH box helicase family protein [Methanoculleus sp.]
MIRRFSSRRERLDTSFLNDRLKGAHAYDRIAGYFSSSILEVAGENLDQITGTVRMVCNSQLDAMDVKTAQAAVGAMRREWCATEPEKLGERSRSRFQKLHDYLTSGKLEVRVLPDAAFGLIHGKAGIITLADGTKTAFMGSANESKSAWRLNYELIWEDDSPEAVRWVEEEFDALWNHKDCRRLSEFVIEDVGRIARRTVIPSIEEWEKDPEPAAAVIESPVYRRELGLWEHQKYFVKLAFDTHQTPHGARFLLADMVGLGKTLQLAMSAMLMALTGDRPILVLAPKTLLWQWQDEMKNLLDLPSAVWNGRQWVDEEGIEHPVMGDEGIIRCPRRIGIVSYGLITYGYSNPDKSKVPDLLKQKKYECIIVDEVHRARRKKLTPGQEYHKAQPNNLLAFLREISERTKSILLATATPVQLNPIEAYDLLSILAGGSNTSVLGNRWSLWNRESARSLEIIQGREPAPSDVYEIWKWLCNPFPPASEGRDYRIIRNELGLNDDVTVADPTMWERLAPPVQSRIRKIGEDLFAHQNPYIRHIVRRSREYLENTPNPETGEPYLKAVKVNLFGEGDRDALHLTTYLREAYESAEEFCRLLSERAKGTGFLKTLLLRRAGSSLYAGRLTAETMLGTRRDDSDPGEDEAEPMSGMFAGMTEDEKEALRRFIMILKDHEDEDPKYQRVKELLFDERWIDRGCIIFSQYYDSIHWLAERLKDEIGDEPIGIYAGGSKSKIYEQGVFRRANREEIKSLVQKGHIRLLLGTDSASEGLNLQKLGTLINLDLPWNPTRLEQRKGRIQRIGQIYDEVWIYNMRYKGSVEDRVHDLLSERLEDINSMFGQIPDVLEDVWVDVALNKIEEARKTIDAVPPQHPFEMRYNTIEPIHWESCVKVLDGGDVRKEFLKGW